MASPSIELPPLVTGPWRLADLKAGKIGSPKNGLKVFTTFHCGGGSSMGYKLAGFDVVGGVEIDKRMMAVYRKNHKIAEHCSFLMGIQEFNKLPRHKWSQFEDIDVLDGSPPCSTFSMSGNRGDDWGRERKFLEGQASQVLSDLFFDFIETANLLRPKIVVAENVKGMIAGGAKWYVKQVFERFRAIGYEPQLFLLNASTMGVPQLRERIFFICRRQDLKLPKFNIKFNEQPVSISAALAGADATGGVMLTKMRLKLWTSTFPGEGMNKAHPKGSWFAHRRPHPLKPSPTIISGTPTYHWEDPRHLSTQEIARVQSFPDDYDFNGHKAQYICGMSVPPLMMQRVALHVAKTLLLKK